VSETSAYKIQTPGELPRRKHTTFRTQRKFEIKYILGREAHQNVTVTSKQLLRRLKEVGVQAGSIDHGLQSGMPRYITIYIQLLVGTFAVL